MRKRVWFLSLSSFLLLGLVVCIACVAWLVSTTEGTRAIVGALSRLAGSAGIHLEVRKVAGSLISEVQLEDISIRLQDAEIHITDTRLRCQPHYILLGKLAVEELQIRHLEVHDKRRDVERPIDLTWPRAPFWLGTFEGWINRLDLSEFSYHRLDKEPVRLAHVHAHLFWHRGILHASSIDSSLGFGRIEGNLSAGFVRPGLDALLTLTPAHPEGISKVSISAHIAPALFTRELSGSMSMSIKPEARPEIRVTSRLALVKQRIVVDKMDISEKGRRGTINGEGSIDLSSPVTRASLAARVRDLDLSSELGGKASASGTVNVSGNSESYTGLFSLDSRGASWRSINLSGDFEGNAGQARLRLRKGAVLGASITGEVYAVRGKTFSVEGNLRGRGFNPAKLLPTWDGEINADVHGKVRIIDGMPEVTIAAGFPQSRLRGYPVTGKLEAQLEKGLLTIPGFELHAKGFDLVARGALKEKITYDARISDLSAIVRGGNGRILADGWVHWATSGLAGTLRSTGSHLSFDPIAIDAFSLELTGSAVDHMLTCDMRWPQGQAAAKARGSYRNGAWQATLMKLEGSDRVAPWKLTENVSLLISAQRIVVSRVALAGATGERVELSADMSFNPRRGFLMADWQGINLARFQGVLEKAAIAGGTNGALKAEWLDKGGPALSCTITATGTLSYQSVDVTITEASASLNWGRQGLLASWEMNTASGTRVNGRAVSNEALRPSFPDRARIEMAWDGLDPATIKTWLKTPSKPTPAAGRPRATKLGFARSGGARRGDDKSMHMKAAWYDEFDVQGRLSGTVRGELLPGRQVIAHGETSLAQGTITWRSTEGLIKTTVEQAKVDWTWEEKSLTGDIVLGLSRYGQIKASFRLPIPARMPPVIEQDGPISIAATGEVRERGVLSAFFPGLIQESTGHLTLDASGGGTWSKPALKGQIHLKEAGAYLPPAGIHLKDVEIKAEFDEDQIRVTSFAVHSGQGELHGKGTLRLKNWRIAGYEGSLRGERFQAVYLPELQVLTDPELTFEGTTTKMVVRGTIRVPDFLLRRPEMQNLVRPSPDIVIVGSPTKETPGASANLDAQVQVVLGDHVRIQTMGLNAHLGGTLLVLATSIDNVTARGEVRITKGEYASAGVKLDITRGRIIFSGGPPDKAALDIVATRKVHQVATPGKLGAGEDLLVGVNAGGTISSPAVKLYSDPAMTDSQVLSYIVFGRPLSPGTEESALLSKAAGALLAAGPSSGIQQRLKSELGLDIIDIAPSSDSTNVTRSLVTVGKYLSPQLFVSFGYSLFTGENLLTARYRLSKHWEVESKSGTQVGADLFYRIEFD